MALRSMTVTRPAFSVPGLRLEPLASAQRDQAKRIWTGLLHQTGDADITTSWAWVSSWLESFGDVVPHRFLVVCDDGAPIAITLVTHGVGQHRGPLPIRTVHLGTAGEQPGESVVVEHNRLLAQPGRHGAALAAIVVELGRSPLSADLLMLDGFAADELAGWNADGFRIRRETCHIADLAAIRASGQPIERAFGSNMPKKMRQNYRRFEEQYGPIALEWIEDTERAQVVFRELVELHQARWHREGMAGAFASERVRRFHQLLIDRLLPSERVILARVTAGDEVVGISYGFVERGEIHHYSWGLGQYDAKRLSPGFVTGMQVMQEAMDRGYRELNWLAGDALYKRELATTTRELIWAERPVSPYVRAVEGLITLKGWAQTRRRPW